MLLPQNGITGNDVSSSFQITSNCSHAFIHFCLICNSRLLTNYCHFKNSKQGREDSLAWVAPRAGDLGEPNPSAAPDFSPSLLHLAAAGDGPPECRARPLGWRRRGSRQGGSRVTRAG
jgi:hypothetical protein